MSMADEIFETVRVRRHVSFVELERMIPGFNGEDPHRCFCFSEHPSLVIWLNLSDEALAALEELRKAKKVFLNPCSYLVYLVDGKTLSLPIPKRMPKKDTKKDYWVPCVLDTEPSKEMEKAAKAVARQQAQKGTKKGNESQPLTR